jgi:hypothetical protein
MKVYIVTKDGYPLMVFATLDGAREYGRDLEGEATAHRHTYAVTEWTVRVA